MLKRLAETEFPVHGKVSFTIRVLGAGSRVITPAGYQLGRIRREEHNEWRNFRWGNCSVLSETAVWTNSWPRLPPIKFVSIHHTLYRAGIENRALRTDTC